MAPFTTRALCVARAPHQQRASTCERRVLVGDLEHPPGPLEQLAAEVGEQAEREHVDLQIVDHTGELIALLDAVELGLVADQIVDRPVPDRQRIQVEIRASLRSPVPPRRGGS